MADPGDLTLQHLSFCTDGMPIVITGLAVATPTDVHQHGADANVKDMVTLFLCNTSGATVSVGVVIYSGTPADPTNVVAKIDLYAGGGPVVVLDGHPISNSRKVAVFCATPSVVTAFGRVARATS